MNPKEKASVQQQFGSVAANYSTSAVHAKGQDLTLMVQSVTLTGTERVLDAGCGAGHTALAFAPHVAEVVAYDLTPAMLEQVEQLAAERAIENVTVQQGDVEKLPFPNASFDLVVTRYSAHHWAHPVTALREFARVLKPGCPFLLGDVVAPDDLAQDTFLQTIELLRDPSHVRDHTVRQWLAMMDEAGFHYPEVFSSWDLYLDFASWVKRTATPPECVTMIQGLFNISPDTITRAMRVQSDYSFTIQAALIHTIT